MAKDLLKRLLEAQSRPDVKAMIDKALKKAPYGYPVSSVEGNMYLFNSLFPDIEKKLRTKMTDEEKDYADTMLWKVQPYTNWSGD